MVSAIGAGRLRPRVAPIAAALAATVATAAFSVAWAGGGGPIVDLPWMGFVGSRMQLGLDPLGAPLAVFAAGLAAPILVYAGGYLPSRTQTELRARVRFCAWMLAFMTVMLLLLVAQDLLVLFLALELTAAGSFSLIRHDRTEEAERSAALALMVTAGSSFLFLAGVLLVVADTGTASLPALRSLPAGDGASTPALACILLGLIGKSAQVPVHFWLPRAMAAPTPVSAYLHSAALVAAGVFTLQRLRFLFADAPGVLEAMVWIGFASIAVGGSMALVEGHLKRILAYSTIAQYGYAMVLLGLGGEAGLTGAPFFLLAHGLCKSALFMTAGAVQHATGAEHLGDPSPSLRTAPWLAGGSAIAAAGLAGLPLTIGYFKDEHLFAAALHHGPVLVVASVVAAAVTVAYTARFWLGVFAGPTSGRRGHTERSLVGPVVLLAVPVLLGGVWLEPLSDAFAAAGSVVAARPVPLHLHYAVNPELAMGASAWAAGLLLYGVRRFWEPGLSWLAGGTAHLLGPAAWARRLSHGTRWLSDALHDAELRDLRDRVGAVFVPAAVLVGLALFAHGVVPSDGAFEVRTPDVPLVAALVLTAGAALGAVRPREHLALLLQLSFVGFSLALAFLVAGAPDVALVLVVVETALTVLLVAFLRHVRPALLEEARRKEKRRRIPWTGLMAGTTAFFVSWNALGAPKGNPVARRHIELADEAHAHDVVTAILTDFRGLDTGGELTVLAVAVLGAMAISWGVRS